MLKVPFEGLLELLSYYQVKFNGAPPTLHLYKATYTPVDGDTLATYTAKEITATGYAAVNLDSWGDPFMDGIRAKIINDAHTFAVTGASSVQQVGGYFVVNNAADAVLWAEQEPDPVDFYQVGHKYAVIPALTEKSELED